MIDEARPGSRIRGVLRFPVDAVIDFLAEDTCTVCGRPRGGSSGNDRVVDEPARYLVEPVRVRCLLGVLSAVNHPVCRVCAADLVLAGSPGRLDVGSGSPTTEDGGVTPPEADGEDPSRHEQPPATETIAVISPFMTTDGVLKIIHQLKFNGYVALADPIARTIGWALRWFAGRSGSLGLVVPTPMDERSRRARGFNQAECIARSLAGHLDLPLATDVLQKTARTQRQSQTPRDERAANVRGAFACPVGAARTLAGQPVVLVDDLVTSGATAGVCALALLAGGAASVTVACFGRAL